MNEILPPRVRFSWSLTRVRFSNMRRAGMSRTEVAVGTSREMSMFFAIALATPRRAVSPDSGDSALSALSIGDFFACCGIFLFGVRVGSGPLEGRRPVSLASASVAAARFAIGAASWAAPRADDLMLLPGLASVAEAFLVK